MVVRSLTAAIPGWLLVICGVCLRAASRTGAAMKALLVPRSAARLRELDNRGTARRPPRLASHGDESPFQISWPIAAGTARARRAGPQGQSPARGAPDPAPRSGAALIQQGPIRQSGRPVVCPDPSSKRAAKLEHHYAQVPATTRGYGHGALPAARVDRFVDRRAR